MSCGIGALLLGLVLIFVAFFFIVIFPWLLEANWGALISELKKLRW